MGENRYVYTPYGYGLIEDDSYPKKVKVRLDWGADAFLQAGLIQDSIPFEVKLFAASRKVYKFNLKIHNTFESVFERIKKELQLNSFSSLKVIYPMGVLKDIKPNDTPRSAKLPANARLVGVIKHHFVWDEHFRAPNIEIMNNGNTALKKNEEKYESVLANVGLSSGSHYWEVKVDKYVSDEDIFIGVAHKNVNLELRPTKTSGFWGYLCTRGCKFGPSNLIQEYAEPSRTGDVIGVHLEFNEGKATLSFSKNGISLGPAFVDLEGPVYPAVCLYYIEAQVTITCHY